MACWLVSDTVLVLYYGSINQNSSFSLTRVLALFESNSCDIRAYVCLLDKVYTCWILLLCFKHFPVKLSFVRIRFGELILFWAIIHQIGNATVSRYSNSCGVLPFAFKIQRRSYLSIYLRFFMLL